MMLRTTNIVHFGFQTVRPFSSTIKKESVFEFGAHDLMPKDSDIVNFEEDDIKQFRILDSL